MSQHSRFRGAVGLRRAVMAAALVGVTFLGSVDAQDYIKAERPKQDEFSDFVDFQRGGKPVVDPANNKATTDRNRKLLDRISQWLVFQLTEPQFHAAQGTDGMSKLVRDASARMLFQPPRAKQNAQQKQFVEEFGKIMVANLDKVTGNSKPVVRLNAARMLSEVARTGYDGAAEPCLTILQKDDSDGVKFWALRGLRNLFAIVEDPALDDQGVSIFSRRDLNQAAQNTNKDLERRCVVALCNYVTRKNEIAPDTPANQLDGLRYVRREAIRALGHVRMQSVRKQFNGPVEVRPALVLLRVANGDNPAPEPSIAERVEAIIGFCQLYTDRERDLNVDYAMFHLGQALIAIGEFRLANMTNEDIPWKERANDLQAALEGWQKHVQKMLLTDAAMVKGFVDMVSTELLSPIQQGQAGLNPNPQNARAWLRTRQPQQTSLFKNDAESVVHPPAGKNEAAATGGR
jgi:HEAT repeat protein